MTEEKLEAARVADDGDGFLRAISRILLVSGKENTDQIGTTGSPAGGESEPMMMFRETSFITSKAV